MRYKIIAIGNTYAYFGSNGIHTYTGGLDTKSEPIIFMSDNFNDAAKFATTGFAGDDIHDLIYQDKIKDENLPIQVIYENGNLHYGNGILKIAIVREDHPLFTRDVITQKSVVTKYYKNAIDQALRNTYEKAI